VEEIVQYTCHYGKDQVPFTWQSSLEHLKGCVILTDLLLMPFESGELPRVLNNLKERVAGVQQDCQWRRLPNFTEDMTHIEEFKSMLNEAMGAFNVCVLFLSFN
jgi:hypothetical protein